MIALVLVLVLVLVVILNLYFFRAQGKEFIPTIQYQFPLIFQSHSSPQIMIVVVVVVVVAQMINVNN